MRRTLHISLPPQLRTWLDAEVHRRGYTSSNAFIRHLLVQEKKRVCERRQPGAPAGRDDPLLLPPHGVYPTRRPRT